MAIDVPDYYGDEPARSVPLNGYVNTNGAGSGAGTGPFNTQEVNKRNFDQIEWGAMHRKNEKDVQEFLTKDALKQLEELRQKVAEQDQHLREETWYCVACTSTFPKMAVRQSILGTLQCPRCANHNPGNVVRAVEAVRQSFQKMVDGLRARVAELEAENAKMKEELGQLRKLRLRPGQARIVEDEPPAV